MKIKKQLLPLALALNLMLSSTQATIFAADEPATEQTAPVDPAPEEKVPADPDHAEKSKTQDTETQKNNGTTWDVNGLSTNCPANTYCDGAPTQQTSDWQNILTMLGILFGDAGSSSGSDGAGINGNSGYDTIGTPTDPGSTIVDTPTGDFSTITPAGSPDPNWSDIPKGPDLTGVTLGILGGIPISANASYNYSYVGPGSFKVLANVNPANPEIDQNVMFSAIVTPTIPSVHVYPPSQSVSETYTKGGDYSKIFTFNTIEYATNSKPKYGKLTVKVNARVYEGSTALCDSSESTCDNGLENGNEFGNTVPTTNTTTGGSSDLNSGFTGSTGTSSNGSNLLDNIFGNGSSSGSGSNITANANNPDWLSDGFSNIAQNNGDSSIPDGFGSQFADQGNTISVPADSAPIAQNSTEYGQTEQPYTDVRNSQNTGYSDASTPTTGNAGGTAETASIQDSALGSIFSKIDTAIGNDPASAGSLTSKFASLTNTASNAIESATGFKLKDSSLPGSQRGLTTDTTAELKELATRMLNAGGMSQDDIKKGRQYDQGSAYTDPSDAWNLNRMSAAKAQTQIKNTNQKTTTIQ